MSTMTLLRVLAATLLLVSLIVIISPISTVGHTNQISGHNPFGFIHQLKGARRGQSIEGLRDLKQYLQKFGYYLNDDNKDTYANVDQNDDDDDEFDEFLEAAIKRYQRTYRIPVSGALDHATTTQMMIPRCGVSDHGLVMTVDYGDQKKSNDYAFFPGKPKWNKNHLRYKFGPKSLPPAGLKEATIKAAVDKAFQSWKNVTKFTFEYVANRTADAEVEISFYSRDHGDKYPFDGPSGTLAHAFAPRYGLLHYDADEEWSDDPSPMEIDLESVGLHEIGHALGLLHSYSYQAVMNPFLGPGQIKRKLQRADIEGIRDLYNLPSK